MCTLDIVTAEPLASVLLVGIISKWTIISRTLVITSKILDLCFSGNRVYVSIWVAAFIGFKLCNINF